MTEYAIALGFFDGVHTAHQAIVSAAVVAAKKRGIIGRALTFDLPPSAVLGRRSPALLTGNGEKKRLVSALGADCVFLRTTPRLLSLGGEEFVRDILKKELHAEYAACGYNYTFGSDRLGSGDLAALGRKYGFDVEVLPERQLDGEAISSSRIRALLAEGNAEKAAAMLGRPYSFTGIVAHGKQLGRAMGFPTINIYPPSWRADVRHGVYASLVCFNGESHIGVTNVGVNPTVNDGGLRVETHIPDYSGDLYGVEAEVRLVRFMRPEQKFPSANELFAQIRRDSENIISYFSRNHS